MKVSVIIPTYNGAHKIINLLRALENQTCKDFETIVVIDGSTDNTNGILASNKFNLKSIKLISQENKGRAAVRNRGAEEASGDLLIFFDDDIIPENNCIELHLLHHNKYANSILVGVARINKYFDENIDFYQYRYYIEDNWQKPFQGKLTKVTYDNYAFTTSNLSLQKSLFFVLGGFDRRLNDSEDFDFSIRALQGNIPIYFDYNIWALHCDYINIKSYIKRQREYLKSKADLAIIKPGYLKLHSASFSRNKISKMKKMVMRFFILNHFWETILNSKLFLLIIPKKIRYRLYSIIIFSSSII